MAKIRFEKGNKAGVKFSKTRQPKKNGRKPSCINGLIDSFGIDNEGEKISKEDALKLLAFILSCTKSKIEALLRNPELPFSTYIYIAGMISDGKNGNTNTVDKVFDRVYGRSTQPTEITGAGGVPLIPDEPMSRKNYEKLLKDLRCGGQ